MRRWNLFHLLILQVAFTVPCAPAGAVPPSTPVAESVAVKLQKALTDFQPNLGTLEPWQTRLFQEEVLPHSARFVRDFRTQGGGLAVDVDSESIRSYLRFYGPKSLKREKPEALLVLRPESGCDLCAQNTPAILKLARERLERRGLVIVTPFPELDPKLVGKGLDEQIAREASRLKAPVTLLVEWKKAAVDSAHAEELRFVVRVNLVIRDISKHEGQLEIFHTGNFEKAARQLLTDFFTELGTQLDRAPVQLADGDNQGYELELTGVRDFAHYTSLKTLLVQSGLPIEERKLSRGKAIFAVYSERSLEEVKAHFFKVDLNGMGGDSPVQMEIR